MIFSFPEELSVMYCDMLTSIGALVLSPDKKQKVCGATRRHAPPHRRRSGVTNDARDARGGGALEGRPSRAPSHSRRRCDWRIRRGSELGLGRRGSARGASTVRHRPRRPPERATTEREAAAGHRKRDVERKGADLRREPRRERGMGRLRTIHVAPARPRVEGLMSARPVCMFYRPSPTALRRVGRLSSDVEFGWGGGQVGWSNGAVRHVTHVRRSVFCVLRVMLVGWS